MLSEEQQRVVQLWQDGKDIRTSAVTGSGKSTILIECAKVKDDCLLLTYNKSLASEIQEKVNRIGIRLNCFTIHGLCSRLTQTCIDDYDVEECLQYIKSNEITLPFAVSGLLLDEAQDLKDIYVQFIQSCQLLNKQVLIVGKTLSRISEYFS
jgi:superfamily II DNA or RNA helicase